MRNYSGPSTVQGPHPGQRNSAPDDVSHFSKNWRRMKLFSFYTLLIMAARRGERGAPCALHVDKLAQLMDSKASYLNCR